MEHVELDLVRDLVLPLVRVVLMCLHNLLIVPGSRQASRAEVLQQLHQPEKHGDSPVVAPEEDSWSPSGMHSTAKHY